MYIYCLKTVRRQRPEAFSVPFPPDAMRIALTVPYRHTVHGGDGTSGQAGCAGLAKNTDSIKNQATQQQVDLAIARQIQQLKMTENRVIAHERAHQAAGGPYTGAARYTYQRGPDGRRYIAGGEVSIDTSESNDPEETIRKMEQVQRAALAPADPSPQDLAIAAKAAMSIARARMELAMEQIRQQVSERETVFNLFA